MFARQLENYWRSIPKPRPVVDPAWAAARRREYLAGESARLKALLLQTRVDLGAAIVRGDKFTEAYETDRLSDVKREMEKVTKALAFVGSTPREGQITQDMIDRARAFPIRQLIEADRDQVTCPFHKDLKPSASVRKGFFYCFTCGKNLNAIDWLMEVKGFTFPDAVRKLAGAA